MADFQTKFKTECDQPYFRNTVRHIVHDETFVNNLLRNLSLQHQITNQVDKELKTKVPYEVNHIAKTVVKSKTNDFIINKLPQLVTSQLQCQLNNNMQMN